MRSPSKQQQRKQRTRTQTNPTRTRAVYTEIIKNTKSTKKTVECWGTEGFDPTNYGMTGDLGKGTEGTPWVTEDLFGLPWR